MLPMGKPTGQARSTIALWNALVREIAFRYPAALYAGITENV